MEESIPNTPYVTVMRRLIWHSAHKLSEHSGHCQNWHGHSYKIDVYVTGRLDTYTNMVMDTAELDKRINAVIGHADHNNLNDVFESDNPTMEYMAWKIYESLKSVIPVAEVHVWETRDACAIYPAIRR